MEGTITSIVVERGFGFIRRPAGSDLFFHCSEVAPELGFDERLIERRVKFDVVSTPKGERAIKVSAVG